MSYYFDEADIFLERSDNSTECDTDHDDPHRDGHDGRTAEDIVDGAVVPPDRLHPNTNGQQNHSHNLK